jgi:hypothetical protein
MGKPVELALVFFERICHFESFARNSLVLLFVGDCVFDVHSPSCTSAFLSNGPETFPW